MIYTLNLVLHDNNQKKDRYDYFIKNHKPLKFGTSGLRGLDIELTDLQIYISTKGFLKYLINKGMIRPGGNVALAGDYRPSTKRISIAIAAAILDMGFIVDYSGKIPTPVVSLWGFYNKIPSLMVTGSHNPYGQNGVKFNKINSEVLKDDEKEILVEIEKVMIEEYRKPFEFSLFSDNGYFKNYEDMNQEQRWFYLNSRVRVADSNINSKPQELYINRYKAAFGNLLEKQKIVFYQQTSVGRYIIPKILEELGAKVILEEKVDETKEFVAVDTEDMKEHILEKMANLAFKNNSFICITCDGDSDRPAVVFLKKDKDGRHVHIDGKLQHHYIKGDKLNFMASILLKPDFVAVPVSANHKGVLLLKKNGIEVKLTKVGSPHVIKAMNNRIIYEQRLHKEKGIDLDHEEIMEKLSLYAFEVNGGGLLGSKKKLPKELFMDYHESSEYREIGPLPTRDSVFPIICSIALSKKLGKTLEETYNDTFSGKHESYSDAGLVENLPGVKVTQGIERYNSNVGKMIIESFSIDSNDIIEVHYNDNIKCYNENNIEIPVNRIILDKLKNIHDILINYINSIINEDEFEILKINYLDGIRIYLSNEEIIHLRPSGNAAQFRIYVESDNLERSRMLVKNAIHEKDGVLVRLINDFIDGKINL
jgi:phosphomannomutase